MTDQELFDVYDGYMAGRGFSMSTRRRRVASLGSFAVFMAPRPITTAGAADVDEWLSRLTAPATRNAYYSDLRGFFGWAIRRELIERDPMTMTDPPKRCKHLPKPARADVIATAIAISSGPVQLMILLGALAGLRASEIAAVSTDDIFVDSEPAVLVVRQGKGGRDRVVPLHPVLIERLKNVRSGYLFPSPRAGIAHMNAGSVGAVVRAALTKASDGKVTTCHTLRHFFGTEAARWANGNLILVSGLMGHASPSTTLGYIAWSPMDGAEIVSMIGGGSRLNVVDELAARRQAV